MIARAEGGDLATERQPVEPYLDAKGAANFLHIGHKTVQQWARVGTLPAYPVPIGKKKHWLFRESELDAWVRSQVP